MAVVYAKEPQALAAFYRSTLELAVLDEQAGFIALGGEGVDLVVVRMAERIAKAVRISTPPELRESTPVKLSFRVRDLGRAREAAIATGGGTKKLGEAWSWRGELHLDGFDPEGNVVQFRQVAAPA